MLAVGSALFGLVATTAFARFLLLDIHARGSAIDADVARDVAPRPAKGQGSRGRTVGRCGEAGSIRGGRSGGDRRIVDSCLGFSAADLAGDVQRFPAASANGKPSGG